MQLFRSNNVALHSQTARNNGAVTVFVRDSDFKFYHFHLFYHFGVIPSVHMAGCVSL
jgi:hypothetical protein